MPKYQIRFCDKRGCGSFEYIDVKSIKGVEQKAADKATQYIQNKRACWQESAGWNPFVAINPFKPQRVVHVWEWDTVNKCVKKGGHRFKLQLAYFQATYTNGAKKRSEWYEPVIETKK